MEARVIPWKSLRIAGLALAVGGCGPVQYLTTVSQSASAEVAAAKSANAEKYAPFEYTAAVAYLHKAREEEGYADHQAAVKFGRLARDHAIKARKIAIDKAGLPDEPLPTETDSGLDAPETENPLEKVRSEGAGGR
jgi:hypothetical protein